MVGAPSVVPGFRSELEAIFAWPESARLARSSLLGSACMPVYPRAGFWLPDPEAVAEAEQVEGLTLQGCGCGDDLEGRQGRVGGMEEALVLAGPLSLQERVLAGREPLTGKVRVGEI